MPKTIDLGFYPLVSEQEYETLPDHIEALLLPPQITLYTSLRDAIADLPDRVRAQLTNDDEMQFTSVGIEKWLNMTAGATHANTLTSLYQGAVQAYYEEQLARDLAPDPGERFRDRTA